MSIADEILARVEEFNKVWARVEPMPIVLPESQREKVMPYLEEKDGRYYYYEREVLFQQPIPEGEWEICDTDMQE